MSSPIGVPGPTRVNRSFISWVSISSVWRSRARNHELVFVVGKQRLLLELVGHDRFRRRQSGHPPALSIIVWRLTLAELAGLCRRFAQARPRQIDSLL